MMPVLARDVAQKTTKARPSLQSEEFANVKFLQTGVAMVHSLLLMPAKSGIKMANHPLFLFFLSQTNWSPFGLGFFRTRCSCVCATDFIMTWHNKHHPRGQIVTLWRLQLTLSSSQSDTYLQT
jgi:hypothetical protein